MRLGILSNFIESESGNFAMTFGLLMLPVMFLLGTALDYSGISRERSRLQETADASVLYAVKELGKSGYSENDLKERAEDAIAANFDITGVVASSVVLDQEANTLTVALSKQYETAFLQLMHASHVNLNVVSKVQYGENYTGAKCLMTLSETGKGVFAFNGNAVVDATNCGVHVNSNSSDAVDLNGSGTELHSKENCFVGGVQSGLTRITPPPEDYCYVLPDPFDEHPTPAVGACDYYNFSAHGNTSVTLSPGVYCSGLSLSSGITANLEPGLYVIKNGPFKTTGSVYLHGIGVTFYFVGNDVEVDFSGGTTFHLIAMDQGELAGFIFFFDPSADLTETSSFSGNSSTYFEGILYFGRRDVTVDGSSQVNSTSPFSALIANTLTLNGNGTIHFDVDEENTHLPVSEQLYNKDIVPYLIQ